jgi:tetratricopeptide (TPR) repeat protein
MKITLIIILVLSSLNLLAQPEAVLLKKADSLFSAKKIEEATVLYTKIIKLNPKNEKALKGRGDIYFNQEKFSLAEQDYKQILLLAKNCFFCYVNLATIKISQTDVTGANKYISQAFNLDSNNSKAFVARGQIRFYEEKYEQAKADYTKAIELDSVSVAAYYYKALLSIRQEEYDQGAHEMSTVIRLDSSISPAWYQRGIYYANNQKWDEALYDFTKASAIDSLNSNYVSYIANVYLYKADPATAYTYYSKAVKLNDKNFEAHYYKSVAAYRMEEMENSCVCLRAMQSKLPAKIEDESILELQNKMNEQLKEYCDTNFSAYYYQRGIAAYNKGEYTVAIEWYNEGLKKFHGHFMMNSFRGNANLAKGEYKEAESDYTRTLGLTDHLDMELKEASSYKDEVASTQKTLREATIAYVYSNRAEVRFNMNNPKGAEADIETALKMMPADTPEKEYFYNIRGIIYLSENDNSNALSYFNKAIQVNPGFVSGYINRALVKVNLAYKIRVISSVFFIQNKNINTLLDLPLLKKTTVNRDNLSAALADCNKAIQIDGKNSYAYQIRAYIKLLLGEGDYCYDLLKAEQLGSTQATALINEQKCR